MTKKSFAIKSSITLRNYSFFWVYRVMNEPSWPDVQVG